MIEIIKPSHPLNFEEKSKINWMISVRYFWHNFYGIFLWHEIIANITLQRQVQLVNIHQKLCNEYKTGNNCTKKGNADCVGLRSK